MIAKAPLEPEQKGARAMCGRCRRPKGVCFCHLLPLLPTRMRVLILQHPRERRMGIGTARMAHLGLPGSTLRVGLDFSRDPEVASTLDGSVSSYLLFPGPRSIDARRLPVEPPPGSTRTLVVLDGTWSEARTLLRLNPALAALPRIAFSRARPSEYRIRRQPADFCLSTIEALAEVLGILEPDGGPFERLLDPFRAMVERQEYFETEIRSNRHRRDVRLRGMAPKPPTLAMRLLAEWPRLVCVQGEANAWPANSPGRPPPETVHFVAWRPATGAIYEAIVAPKSRLAPSIEAHLELPATRLKAGGTVEEWRRSWRSFSRPDDVLLHWGAFHARLATAEGVALPSRRMDLRAELAHHFAKRAGTLEECALRLGAATEKIDLAGRGGRRLAVLAGVLRALCESPGV